MGKSKSTMMELDRHYNHITATVHGLKFVQHKHHVVSASYC